MKKRFTLTITVALLAMLRCSVAFGQLTLTGEVRPRTEYRNGFKTLIDDGQKPALFTEQRTRLYVNYKTDKLVLQLSLQDVRIWGAANQVYKEDPSLSNINEGYAQYFFVPDFSMKVGRQELNYDNARFLGDLRWAQQSRSHDLFAFLYGKDSWKAHVGFAFNQDANTPEYGKLTSTFYSDVKNYKTMQYVWANKKLTEGTDLSFLFLNNGVQTGIQDSTESVKYSQTIGLNTRIKAGKFGITGEVYYQLGEDPAGTTINAYLLSATFGYKGWEKYKPALGVDVLSGTDANVTENNSFNPMYGTNHKFYGHMDYFYVGNGHGNVGLVDIYFNNKISISKRYSIMANLHQFMSQASFIDPISGGNASKTLGTEIDLAFKVMLDEKTNIVFGYSQMFATESMEILKGGNKDLTQNWAWLQLTFKPTLFKSK